jgi:glycine/D-amino acid oxidase-like deaminating enzyme
MDTNHEVGIIGAGIHGASVAFHLAARWGVKSTIFEQAAPAGGPTGRSAAICRAYYTNRYLARIALHEFTPGRFGACRPPAAGCGRARILG